MKKFGNLMFAVCLALIVTILVISRPLSNLDEIWNFNIARGITNGLVPYKDLSMVSTPLLGFLLAIPLKFFGQELFFARICAVIIALICFITIFKILKYLEIKREVSNMVVTFIIGLICSHIYVEYNLLVLLLVLQIILIEIKLIKNNKRNNWIVNVLIGTLAGLTICSKQSVGVIISFITVLIPFFSIKGKLDIWKELKRCIFRSVGILIPVDIFLIYLKQNGAFRDFLDYSIYGIKTFSNSVSYGMFLQNANITYKFLAIVIPLVIGISILTNIILKFKKKENNTILVLSLYSLGMLSIVFPIADRFHFSLAIAPSIILLIYNIKYFIGTNKILRKMNYKYILEFVNIFSVLTVLSVTLYIEYMYSETLGMISKYDYQKHFRYINISESVNKSITTINEFSALKEKKIYILDSTAAVYMIPVDRYNKNYDMFCLGNLGAGGEDAIIENIKNEDALYLIAKDDTPLNWQNPPKVRAYVKENMEYVGSKSYFDIYQNKTIEENTLNSEEDTETEDKNAE
ncbi:MAG: glycosyltransferase family 39 protein [Clostridia bacterium]|nr:glycosyltransferase family 39 protein [Clostridia bacterium]